MKFWRQFQQKSSKYPDLVYIAVTKNTIDWMTYTQRKFISYSSGSKIKAWTDAVSGESPLPGSWAAVFPVSLHGRGTRSSLGPFIRALILLMCTPPSSPNHFPKASPPNTVILGLGFSVSMWEDTGIPSVAPLHSSHR